MPNRRAPATLASLVTLALMASAAAAQQAAPSETPPQRTAADINAIVTAPLPADQAAMKAHVMFLASDAMKGRDAASPEFAIAAQYVAAQFYAAGLKPAGDDGGYLQHVPLIFYKNADDGQMSLVPAKGAAMPLVAGEDFLASPNPAAKETAIEAPVVFVGQGIVAPELGIDDYAGVDVRGKIVVLFGGAPTRLPSEIRAHFSSIAAKAAIAGSRGAVGVIQLESTAKAGRGVPSFAALKAFGGRPRTSWAQKDGTAAPPLGAAPVLGTFSLKGAEKLFAGARTPWAQVAALSAKDGAKFRAEALRPRLKLLLHISFEQADSSNIVGILPGSDPKLADEIVVLSAHLDHIGVSKNAKGDQINNGAEDNAVGIASLIEEARRFAAAPDKPKRSIMFLAVTAEEKGLVGSDYYARNPTVAKERIVANVDLDMPILTYTFEDVVPFGADRSSLGKIVRDAVEPMGLKVSPDPIPEEAIFVRSDHYRFVQQGVPAVFLWPGQAGPGKAATSDFLAKHYHRPSDDITLPIDWAQGVRFVDVNYRIARGIADAAERPHWNKGDFFGTLYNGIGAK